MSSDDDYPRGIPPCKHGLWPHECVDCVRAEVELLRAELRAALLNITGLHDEVERLRAELARLRDDNARLRAYIPLARAAGCDCDYLGPGDPPECDACIERAKLSPEQRAWLMEQA